MCVFPADFLRTHFQTSSKFRRNPMQDHFFLKINAPFLITQYGSTSTFGIFNNANNAKNANSAILRTLSWRISWIISTSTHAMHLLLNC